MRSADVAVGEGRGGVDGAGEEPIAEGTEGDEPDPEFGEGRQHLAFGDQFPDRPGDVFDGYERVDPMRVEQVDDS